VVQSATRYKYAAFSGDLAQLSHGVAKGIELFLGEAAHASHGDFSCSRALIYP
jgi:hypothetical protein